MAGGITIKSPAEIDAMRVACRLAAKTLKLAGELVKPGISTEDINRFVHEYTLENGWVTAPLDYHGFPKSVCTSINEVVCHGIPSSKEILNEGDIVNIDVTTIVDGFHGDTSRTFFVGEVSPELKKLVEVTWECLQRGIAQVNLAFEFERWGRDSIIRTIRIRVVRVCWPWSHFS